MSDQIASAIIGAGGVLLLLLGGALGFLVKRRITNAGDHERALYLNSVADLRIKLQQAGMAPEQVGELETFIHTRPPAAIQGTLSAIEGDDGGSEGDGDNLPSSYWTTYAMATRTGARLDVLDAQIRQQVVELEPLLGADRWEKLQRSQQAWHDFRSAEAAYAAARYQGGTLAPLIGALRQIAIAENRLKELIAEVDERKTFEG